MLEALMHYDLPLWRPPSEAKNLIIQATIGCSFNRCSFCSMYRDKTFGARPLEAVFADIDKAARIWPEARRVFLADGDAMVLPTDHLCRILDKLSERLPELTRVSSYALPANLIKKSIGELERLKDHKLSLLYYGLESGSRDILKRITKGASPKAITEGIGKARSAAMKVSTTMILGLGGTNRWRDHIDSTAELVNKVLPNYLSTLQLGLEASVREEFFRKFGESFTFQNDSGILAEQERLIARLEPAAPVIFRSNHASNALPLAGTLPKDKAKLLELIRGARVGLVPLRPAWARAY